MTNDLLPCPFCGNDDPLDDGMPEASLGVCCGETGCPIDGVVFTRRDWNTRADLVSTPNKPAEVDLDALKRESVKWYWYIFDSSDIIGMPSDREVMFGLLDYLHASGHLATGKAGGEPYRLSIEEQGVMRNALRKSVTVIEQQQPAATAQIDTVDKWEPLKISNGYQYPAQSGEYIVRMIDGAELRSQYDGRFFRRKDNWDKIIPAHEIVCFKAIRAALTPSPEPAFDWKDVKPGMAFKHKKRGTVLHYVGPDMDGVHLVMQEGKTAKYDGWPKSVITRSPEHDIEVAE